MATSHKDIHYFYGNKTFRGKRNTSGYMLGFILQSNKIKNIPKQSGRFGTLSCGVLFNCFSQLFFRVFKREGTIEQGRRTFISEVLYDFDQLSVLDENEYF